jgi:eukaryotic-like serine/threonine-protein kinase
MTEHAKDAEPIFLAALDKATPHERAAYVEGACAGRRELLQRVRELLGCHEASQGPLDAPPPGLGAPVDESPMSEGPGSQIGPYKLLEQIGEGGFGVVFMAEQSAPVRRKVALKLIKPGMDSKQVIARFEVERQALALMDHPNIAHVLDAGTTASGRPYFVMELVKGVPITRFCDANRLTPQQRLELFVSVCQAVQHAHTKGVIHRDLKPGNVLVTLHDGTPVAKVIDFGIAKAMGQQLTDKTQFTGFAQLIGTPLYMSPEQAEMSGLDVDTRSDIYALGVLLYELLTGTTPFDSDRLRAAGYDEMRRILREEEPARPSLRVSTLGEPLTAVSAQRQTDSKRLSQLFRGEVDWIVMKALEKDRGRRYETASAFAADVLRYLHDEPVQACPPAVRYRLRKFVRRNKGPVLAASLVVLALVGGICGTTVGLVRAEQARQAEAQRAEGERRAKDIAEKRLAQVEKGIDLLGLIFEDLDPRAEEKDGRPLRAILGDRLDQAAAALEGEAVGDPLVVARLQDRLGRTYLGLGHPAGAEPLFTKAVATRQAELGPNHPLTLDSRHNQALAYIAAGKRIEAIDLLKQVRDAQVKTLRADHLDTLTTLNDLAWAYKVAGKTTEAIDLLEQVRDARVQKLGPDDLDTLTTLSNLARAYLQAGKKNEAIDLLKQVRDAQVKKFGEEHVHALDALNNLAFAYQAAGKMDDAIDLFEKARDALVPKLGADDPRTLTVLHNLAWMYRAIGRTTKAIPLAEQVRAKRVMYLGVYHPATLQSLDNLALAYRADGKSEQALPLFRQAAEGMEKLQFAHDDAMRIVRNLCTCLEQLQQFDEADVWRRKWLAVVKEKDGPESEAYAAGLERLGSSLLLRKKYADAEPILGECLAIRKKQPVAWTTFNTQLLLGAALLGEEKYADAEPLLVQGYEGMKKSEKEPGQKHHSSSTKERLTEALERLVQLYDAWGMKDKADEWRKKSEEAKSPLKPTANP